MIIEVCVNADAYDPCTYVRIEVGDTPSIVARKLWSDESHQWEWIAVGEETSTHYVTSSIGRRPELRRDLLASNNPPVALSELEAGACP